MSDAYRDSDQERKVSTAATPSDTRESDVDERPENPVDPTFSVVRTTVAFEQVADVVASPMEADGHTSTGDALQNTIRDSIFEASKRSNPASEPDVSDVEQGRATSTDGGAPGSRPSAVRLRSIRVVHSNLDIANPDIANPDIANQDIDGALAAGDVATYLADMLGSLEQVAQRNHLDILSMMIAMAREQAGDDAASHREASG